MQRLPCRQIYADRSDVASQAVWDKVAERGISSADEARHDRGVCDARSHIDRRLLDELDELGAIGGKEA